MPKINMMYAAGTLGLGLLIAVVVYAVVHNPNDAPFAITGKAIGYGLGTLFVVLIAILAASKNKA